MVSTKSMQAAEKAAKAAQEQAVAAVTMGLPSSGDGGQGVPSPRDGELEDETEIETIRATMDRLVVAFERERVERPAERPEREEETRRIWSRFDEVQATLETLRGAPNPPPKSNAGGAGEGGLSATGEPPAGGGAERSGLVAAGGRGDGDGCGGGRGRRGRPGRRD
ncbi:unnamed protein product [Linum trigynum]|uniref:Uncharacterized protein n=1 Tax=Linum trigynum TaxID=586398 RepID=A0AAV2EDG1_9ROSI